MQRVHTDPIDPSSGPSRKTLSIIVIISIAIGGVALIGILITIVFYFCRKKEVPNDSFIPKQPAEEDFAPNYPVLTENNRYST